MFYKSLIKLLLATIAILGCSENKKKEDLVVRKPNVILIMTDDHGYGDLGSHGSSYVKTPTLDSLYGESVRFTDFHVDPSCSPTRAALLTGNYSARAGVWHTIGGRSLLKEGMTTLPEVFAANGYETAIFGKWHLGSNYPFRPQDRGFKETLVHGGGGIGQNSDYWGNDYYGMVSKIDEDMATLLQEIRNMGLDENIIVIFMTDNGPGPWFGGIVIDFKTGFVKEGYSARMRGGKIWGYENAHRVPFFIRWHKGGISGGKDIDALAGHIDVMPTLMDLCGIKRLVNVARSGKYEVRLNRWPEELGKKWLKT